MMKVYEKPSIEFEAYELNATIASGCDDKVSLGPAAPGYVVCDEYKEIPMTVTLFSAYQPGDAPFYDESCTCDLSSQGRNLFTS